MGQKTQRHQSTRTTKIIKEDIFPTRNVFHSRAQFFNIKREYNETLNEYWKKLVDIESTDSTESQPKK